MLLGSCAFRSGSRVSDREDGFAEPSMLRLDDSRDVRGEIGEVHEDGVLVITEDGPLRVRTAPETMFFHEGQVGSREDLREGAPVRASARTGDGTAIWIETREEAR